MFLIKKAFLYKMSIFHVFTSLFFFFQFWLIIVKREGKQGNEKKKAPRKKTIYFLQFCKKKKNFQMWRQTTF